MAPHIEFPNRQNLNARVQRAWTLFGQDGGKSGVEGWRQHTLHIGILRT